MHMGLAWDDDEVQMGVLYLQGKARDGGCVEGEGGCLTLGGDMAGFWYARGRTTGRTHDGEEGASGAGQDFWHRQASAIREFKLMIARLKGCLPGPGWVLRALQPDNTHMPAVVSPSLPACTSISALPRARYTPTSSHPSLCDLLTLPAAVSWPSLTPLQPVQSPPAVNHARRCRLAGAASK